MGRLWRAIPAFVIVLVAYPANYSARLSGYSDAQSSQDLRAEALNLAYNLDHDQAITLLRKAIIESPGDAAPRRTLASVLWLNMLFGRGAVTVDHYLGSFTKTKVALKNPPADVAAEFKRMVAEALALARKRVAEAPRDPQGYYDLGAALGLEASYIATVEGQLMAGFRAARGCFNAHERVLELDPKRNDAALVVGTYRYLIASLPVHMRMLAYVAGFGGGKDRGIALLERAAAGGGEARTDAMFALVLVYNRERRYDDALKVLRQLRAIHPRNRLVVLEEGATALRAGRAAEADTILTEGLARLSRETRPRIPGEEHLWRYKRGAARAALRRPDAIDDLRAATSTGAQDWVAGRAHAELARIALQRGDRTEAAARAKDAETLCRSGDDPVCLEDARKLLRNANGR